MSVLGLHHLSIICRDAQRTILFYTEVLGLRLVKRTVNFDAPGSCHLYFGDHQGSPGTVVTFFVWPESRRGGPGIGGTHHFALTAPSYDALLKWKRRLTDLGIAVHGPYDRRYFTSICFDDPDCAHIEIATDGTALSMDETESEIGTGLQSSPEWLCKGNRDEAAISATTWPVPVTEVSDDMVLRRGLHHITTISSDVGRSHEFYGELLEMRRVKMTTNLDEPTSAHWFWGVGDGRPGTLITAFQYDSGRSRVRMGAGQTHHFALAVGDETALHEWREKLLSAGVSASDIRDRVYFKSVYTHDPDGHIVELATLGPGFTVDESLEELGGSLKLPPWLERNRQLIESRLAPIAIPEPARHRGW